MAEGLLSSSSSSSFGKDQMMDDILPDKMKQMVLSQRVVTAANSIGRPSAKTYEGTIYQKSRDMRPTCSVVDPVGLLDDERYPKEDLNKKFPYFYDSNGRQIWERIKEQHGWTPKGIEQESKVVMEAVNKKMATLKENSRIATEDMMSSCDPIKKRKKNRNHKKKVLGKKTQKWQIVMPGQKINIEEQRLHYHRQIEYYYQDNGEKLTLSDKIFLLRHKLAVLLDEKKEKKELILVDEKLYNSYLQRIEYYGRMAFTSYMGLSEPGKNNVMLEALLESLCYVSQFIDMIQSSYMAKNWFKEEYQSFMTSFTCRLHNILTFVSLWQQFDEYVKPKTVTFKVSADGERLEELYFARGMKAASPEVEDAIVISNKLGVEWGNMDSAIHGEFDPVTNSYKK